MAADRGSFNLPITNTNVQ